jgi:hypothetical protein
MIQKYEQPPVDRKLLCAREAMAEPLHDITASSFRAGEKDDWDAIKACIRAIELWEEGFGRD